MQTFHRLHKATSSVASRAATIAAAIAIALILVAPSARAQGYGRTIAISGFGGYNIASDIYNGYSGVNNSSLELKNAFMYGGRLTVFTNEFSAVEFAWTKNEADLAVRTTTVALPPDFDAGKIKSDEFDLNFLISQPAPNPRVWPYFTLGFGWTATNPDVRAINPTTSQPIDVKGNTLFAFNFGIGTMAELNPKLALRLDARWRVTDTAITTSSGVYCDYWGYCWSYASDWYNSGELTAGLTYRMGGR